MSASPSPGPSAGAKPKLSRSATPAERQAAALNRLLANPDREVRIPARPQEGATRQLRAPRDMMKNVQGSSAGAGSGEFHVYKQSRRREYERLKIMDEQDEFERAKAEAIARQTAAEAAAAEKTAKNRLKRQRAKEARTKHKGPGGAAAAADAGNVAESGPEAAARALAAANGGDGPDKRRKLAPPVPSTGAEPAAAKGTFTFRSAEEREADDDEAAAAAGNDGTAEVDEARAARERAEADELRRLQEEEERARPAKEAGIVIQDDD
ncbi:hypothetical protein JCM3770_004577 [Rhodotorula araucariae]